MVLLDDLIGHRFALITLRPEPIVDDKDWFERHLGGVVLTNGEHFFDSAGRLQAYMKKRKMSSVLLRPDRYIFDAGDSAKALLGDLKRKLYQYGHTPDAMPNAPLSAVGAQIPPVG